MNISLKTLVLAAAILATGCSRPKDDKAPLIGTFVPEGETRRVEQFARMQAAVGAKEDGMLYAWHFDGKDLSPLGREKLDYIADADTNANLVVYLDVKSETFADRSKSVTAYLQDKGMAASHIVVKEGINDDTLNPASDNMTYLAKTDTAETEGTGGYSTASGATGMSSAK